MQEAVDLNDMGARGNGRKDNHAVFQRALDLGIRKLILGSGEYYISRPLVVYTPDVEIIGQGAEKTVLSGDHHLLFDIRSRPISSCKHEGEIQPRAQSVTLPQPVSVTKGMLLHVSAPHGMPEKTSGGYTSHHAAMISDVQDGQMSFDRMTEIPFKNEITLTVHRAAGFTLRNLTLATDDTPYMITIRNRYKVRIENVVFRSLNRQYMGMYRLTHPQLGVSAIAAYASVDVLVDSCRFEHIWYGLMAHQGCYQVTLQNSIAIASRHINNSGIGTDQFRVVNCTAENCEGGFNSHPTALGTTFIDCKDLQSNSPSTFDGRRDSIVNCVFDRGIRLSTDEGILKLAEDSAQIFKVVSGTHISGAKVSISASNVQLRRCVFESPVMPSLLNGNFTMDDVTIDLSEAKTSEASAFTIADSPASGHTYVFAVRNLKVLGPLLYDGSTSAIGVYVPMRPGVSGEMENVYISGFEKGLVLYGGEESRERYRGVGMTNVQIRDCDYGIYQQDFFDKPLRTADIRITGCRVADNAPGRIKYSPIQGN